MARVEWGIGGTSDPVQGTELAKGLAGLVPGRGIVEESVRLLQAEADPHEFEDELVGVEVLPANLLGGSEGDPPDDFAESLLGFDQAIAHHPGAVVVLLGKRDEDAAALPDLVGDPTAVTVEERLQANPPARLAQGRSDDIAGELIDGLLEDRELERLLRLEVGEEAALGKVHAGGQLTQGHSFEADAPGQAQRLVDDGLPGSTAFAEVHAPRKRPLVLFVKAVFDSMTENKNSYQISSSAKFPKILFWGSVTDVVRPAHQFVTTTGVPISTLLKKFSLMKCGMRMQPCEAGTPGR